VIAPLTDPRHPCTIGGVVEKLIDPVQARPRLAPCHSARDHHARWALVAKECLRPGTTRPDLMIIVEPHAQPNIPSPSLQEDRRAVLAGVKAKPLRGGLRPALTPAAIHAAQNLRTGLETRS
jgi:hypothetical protein